MRQAGLDWQHLKARHYLLRVNAATDRRLQVHVLAEQTKINNKLWPFKYYPMISLGFGYWF